MSKDFKHLRIDEATNYLGNCPQEQLVASAAKLGRERPDLMQTPHLQTILWQRLSKKCLQELEDLDNISADMSILLQSLPMMKEHLVSLCLDDDATEQARLKAIELLSGAVFFTDETVFSTLASSSNEAVRQAAAQTIKSMNTASKMLPKSAKIVPCSQKWADMSPIEGTDKQRTCTECGQAVIVVRSAQEIAKMVGKGCVIYTPTDSSDLQHVVSEPATINPLLQPPDSQQTDNGMLDFVSLPPEEEDPTHLAGFVVPPKDSFTKARADQLTPPPPPPPWTTKTTEGLPRRGETTHVNDGFRLAGAPIQQPPPHIKPSSQSSYVNILMISGILFSLVLCGIALCFWA